MAPRLATRLAFSLSRTSVVTSWPPRTSASSTAEPMYPVAPVRKIRMGAVQLTSGPAEPDTDMERPVKSPDYKVRLEQRDCTRAQRVQHLPSLEHANCGS